MRDVPRTRDAMRERTPMSSLGERADRGQAEKRRSQLTRMFHAGSSRRRKEADGTSLELNPPLYVSGCTSSIRRQPEIILPPGQIFARLHVCGESNYSRAL